MTNLLKPIPFFPAKMTKKRTIKIENSKGEEAVNQQSLQEKYMQMQMMDQQVKQLQKYIQTFDQQLTEIRGLIGAIKEFSELKKGDTILAPIANGLFVKGKLEESKELLINVGGGVVVNKSIPDAIKLLESQEAEVASYRTETLSNITELLKQVESLQE
jgi:prefoldin alpha subunit